MPADPSYANPPTDRRALRCHHGGKSREVTTPDLLRYTRAGWPMCRGQVMGYDVETHRPNATDETDERPALRPRA